MKKVLLNPGWKLTHFDSPISAIIKNPPHGWKPVTVPGCVQTSPFGVPLPDLYRRARVREVQWMQKCHWVYRRQLQVPKAAKDQEVRLVFAGLDYIYEVHIDGEKLAAGEGMFHAVVIPLDFAQGKRVQVEVRLAPPPQTKEAGWESTKAQFGRGWDFAPELRTIGIWDDVWLEIVPRLRVESAFIETKLHNRQRALVTVHAELSEVVESGWLDLSLCGTQRRIPVLATNRVTAFVEVESPQLWWPNGLGEPALHDLKLVLDVKARRTEPFVQRVGLREVGRIPAKGQRPIDIPLQFTINQVPFFLNGVNWVPPDSCVGEITSRHYDRQLEKFQEGHVNLVRVWGGGLREKTHFYERCDELGLLVFQEYPIACGMGSTEAYFRQLQSEARHIARTLRRHPCVYIFSGGNENYHYWKMLDSNEPRLKEALRLVLPALNNNVPLTTRDWLAGAIKRYNEPVHLILGGVTAAECPNCLYQNTSAMEGEGEVHGTWNWNPHLGDHRYRGFDTIYEYWLAADQHLYSEASVSSIANLETIREITGQSSNKLPAFDDEIWKLHHGFHAAWDGFRDLWLDLPSTEKVFGPIHTLSDLIALNQYLQAEGGRFMIEELRRKQPTVSGVIWWGVNEPWPGLAGNALIDYHGRPKRSWATISNAFSPVILSLRYDGLQPKSLQGELWLSCNDRHGFNGRYRVQVKNREGRVIDNYEGACSAEYGQSQPLCRLLPVPIASKEQLSVQTTLFDRANRAVHQNLYLFGDIRSAVLQLFASSHRAPSRPKSKQGRQ